MDPRRFDSLTRALAEPKTRRGLLGSLAALSAGLLGARAADAQVTQAQCGNVVCYNRSTETVDRACGPGCVCCVYANGNSRCTPPGQCSGVVTAPTTTTTAAPTTTTTSAPATTTTTTTAALTTSTTTTAPPQAGQGTCLAGQNSCQGQITCNNDPGCACHQTTSGATVCVFVPSLVAAPCQTDAQCVSSHGPGSVCLVCPNLGNGCARPCPV